MTKNTSVTLGKHPDLFISQQLETGRYNSASEVIRDLLEEGEKSGYADYSYESLIESLDQENQ